MWILICHPGLLRGSNESMHMTPEHRDAHKIRALAKKGVILISQVGHPKNSHKRLCVFGLGAVSPRKGLIQPLSTPSPFSSHEIYPSPIEKKRGGAKDKKVDFQKREMLGKIVSTYPFSIPPHVPSSRVCFHSQLAKEKSTPGLGSL